MKTSGAVAVKTKENSGQQGVQSIEVGMRLVHALAAAKTPQMLRDLAAAAKMPAAKAHRYLVSLMRAGLVEQHPISGLYDLGKSAMDIGFAAIARLSPLAIAEPLLASLCAEIGHTVAAAVWANRGATIVRWMGTDTPVAASLRVGSVMPLTRSATGAVFLAYLPRETTESLLMAELLENQRLGLAPERLDAAAAFGERTRRRGYAYTKDFIPGIAGIAAPVFDHTGAMALAFVALGYTVPFDSDLTRIASAVCATAETLSSRLGCGGGGLPHA